MPKKNDDTKSLYINVALEKVEKLLPEYKAARIVLEYSCKNISHYGWLNASLYGTKVGTSDASVLIAMIEGSVMTSVNRDGEEFNSEDIDEMEEHFNNFPEIFEGEDAKRGREASNTIFEHLRETNKEIPDNMFVITSIITCINNAMEVILPELSLENLEEGSAEITSESLTRSISAVFFDKDVVLGELDREAIVKIDMPITYFTEPVNNTIISRFINFAKKEHIALCRTKEKL